jgi:hypothetical protein
MRDHLKTQGTRTGTLAIYGPTASQATKYTATVFVGDEQRTMERWHVATGDIRYSKEIAAEVADFFRTHRVVHTTIADRIMGCPHEEGVDYPLGGVCPDCPFWAELDRFTHEPKIPGAAAAPSAQHITADQVMMALSELRGCPPKAAFAAADFHRQELTPILLDEMAGMLEEPEDLLEEEAHLFTHALYLLAKWREPQAFALVIAWLSLPDEVLEDLTGDVVTEDGGRILAAVAGGDRPEIRALVENQEAYDFNRGSALEALGILVTWGELPREIFTTYLRELVETRLEREESHVWNEVACMVMDLEIRELAPLLREPYEKGWIDNRLADWSDIENPKPRDGLTPLDCFKREHPLIEDIAEETSWWDLYHQSAPNAPATAETKPGRNDQCPCGSGKKYKKCCGKNG